ncbi:hypothetical protein T484DRAFT_1649408 [Baffinella frigidus]|nr:hypothetical protein T484DRAFT_1649408 [Cryptophyta sp. CCMP2293]
MGYTSTLDGVACDACDAGTYKDSTGIGSCTPCGANLFSGGVGKILPSTCEECPPDANAPIGSRYITDCKCNPGYTGTDGATCSACVAGRYKPSTGDASCSLCVENTYSTTTAAVDDLTCTSCPSNSLTVEGSNEVVDCVCKPGWYGPNGGLCEKCLGGEWCYGGINYQCTGVSTSIGPHVCDDCAQNFYSTSVGATSVDTCSACPLYTTTAAGTQQLDSCICVTGYTGSNGAECTPCAAGTFKAIAGSNACTPCGVHTYSPSVAATGSNTCLDCPSFSRSNAGSTKLYDCKCLGGYYNMAGTGR